VTGSLRGTLGDPRRKDDKRAATQDRPGAPRVPSEAPAAGPAIDLFANREDVDRSPAAWAEKLPQAFSGRAEQKVHSASSVRSTGHPGENKSPDQNRAMRNLDPKIKPQAASSQNSETAKQSLKDAPVKIPQSTRRFLKPLVGIDPAAVPVYEGPWA